MSCRPDVLAVSRRDGFSQTVAIGPGHAHDFAASFDAGEVADDVHELALAWSAAHFGCGDRVGCVLRCEQGHVGLEQAVPVGLEAEHWAAEHDRVAQGSARHVLNDPRDTGFFEQFPSGCDEVWVLVALDLLRVCEGLTWG